MSLVVTKGTVISVVRNLDMVQVWVSSPTGDASDSLIFHLPCSSEGQAKIVAAEWRKAWGL